MSHASELIATDIEAYLAEHERKDLLRLLTCGSVDDGKSTLIGRLLHDSRMIYEDQLAGLEVDSTAVGSAGDHLDLALLMDGLRLNGSRASPLTWLTATSRQPVASS